MVLQSDGINLAPVTAELYEAFIFTQVGEHIGQVGPELKLNPVATLNSGIPRASLLSQTSLFAHSQVGTQSFSEGPPTGTGSGLDAADKSVDSLVVSESYTTPVHLPRDVPKSGVSWVILLCTLRCGFLVYFIS